MIQIETLKVAGIEEALYGMRNPKNSWDRSDSSWEFVEDPSVINPNDEVKFILGPNDKKLALALNSGGPVHAKYRRFIDVWFNVTAPLYWWKEFDTYRVGVVDNPSDLEYNSCSTMHKIHEKEFTLDDFSHEHLTAVNLKMLQTQIDSLNIDRKNFIETKDKKYWWQMIQMLPSSYNQKRTVKATYEVLANIYTWRYNHKQDEWNADFAGSFCDWIKTLPCSELITDKAGISSEDIIEASKYVCTLKEKQDEALTRTINKANVTEEEIENSKRKSHLLDVVCKCLELR